jgi:Domain of unknown function (DUF4160)
MPQISRFLGIIIYMYFDDHNPPHFHAHYGDFKAVISINGFALLEGKLPAKTLGLVVRMGSFASTRIVEKLGVNGRK